MEWARRSAGFSAEAVAKKLGTSAEAVLAWESGHRQPTLITLEKLSACYKRPLAAFFLPNPPIEPSPPTDFRSLPDQSGKLSPETLLAIRRAHRLASVAAELKKDLSREFTAKIGQATLEDDTEVVALNERQRLGIEVEMQIAWKDPSEALQTWRNAIERRDILVFQFRVPMKDTRGFSLSEQGVSVIVLNAADARHGRIYALSRIRPPALAPARNLQSRQRLVQWSRWMRR